MFKKDDILQDLGRLEGQVEQINYQAGNLETRVENNFQHNSIQLQRLTEDTNNRIERATRWIIGTVTVVVLTGCTIIGAFLSRLL